MDNYRVSRAEGRLVLTETTASRVITVVVASVMLAMAIVPFVGTPLHPLDRYLAFWAFCVLVMTGVSLWMLHGALRGPETYVFDGAADQVLRNGRLVFPVSTLQRVYFGMPRSNHLRLQVWADGGQLIEISPNHAEGLWLAKDIAEHLGIPWDAPSDYFEPQVRRSWEYAGAFLLAVAAPLAVAGAFVLLLIDGTAHWVIDAGLCALFPLALLVGRFAWRSTVNDIERGLPPPPPPTGKA